VPQENNCVYLYPLLFNNPFFMSLLYLIPARGGSKGVPKKNIKPLGGQPLIYHTLRVATALTAGQHICVSTDDDAIMLAVEAFGLAVPFKRPAHLATDEASTYEVIKHALAFYQQNGQHYETVVLLQPTSPFRTIEQVRQAVALYRQYPDADMVVSVCETQSNPYYVLFEENPNGYLEHSKKGSFTRRQDCPTVYEYNGAIYVIRVDALLRHGSISSFTKVRKYLMTPETSIDIDTPLDWAFAEFLMQYKPA